MKEYYASELVIADAALRPGHEPAEAQQHTVSDDSIWPVWERLFSPELLLDELGGGQTLLAGDWLVVVASS